MKTFQMEIQNCLVRPCIRDGDRKMFLSMWSSLLKCENKIGKSCGIAMVIFWTFHWFLTLSMSSWEGQHFGQLFFRSSFLCWTLENRVFSTKASTKKLGSWTQNSTTHFEGENWFVKKNVEVPPKATISIAFSTKLRNLDVTPIFLRGTM